MSSLQKARFQRLDSRDLGRVVGEVEVQLNPTEFTLNKAAQVAEIAMPGLDSPILQFVRAEELRRIRAGLGADPLNASTIGSAAAVQGAEAPVPEAAGRPERR